MAKTTKVEKVVNQGKKKRIKYGGRKKGTPNKMTVATRQAVIALFYGVMEQGGDAMARYAKAHPGEILKIAARMAGAAE